MRTYSASVVGGGGGGRLSLTGLATSPRYELKAACDMRPEVCAQLEKDYPGIRTFTSHEAMFAQCPTDIVCVSTWPPSHKDITLAALQALPLTGILVEKPLGDTAAAGRTLLDAIQARKLPMCVPHGLQVATHAREILRRVHAGEIGALKLVAIECAQWDISSAGIHWLNFFVLLTRNEPVQWLLAACDTSTRTYRDGMQVETTAVTYAVTQSGVRCVLNTGDEIAVSREGKGCLFRIVGTEGAIEFWGWPSAYRIQNREFPAGETIEVARDERGFHRAHLETMAEQMDRGAPDYALPESSQQALELVEAAYLSHRHRCPVTFPLSSFTPPPPNDWQPGMPYAGQGGGRDGRKLGK